MIPASLIFGLCGKVAVVVPTTISRGGGRDDRRYLNKKSTAIGIPLIARFLSRRSALTCSCIALSGRRRDCISLGWPGIKHDRAIRFRLLDLSHVSIGGCFVGENFAV